MPAGLVVLGFVVYLRLLDRLPRHPETIGDIVVYRKAAEAIVAGWIPYRDYFLEYPPASLVVIAPPALIASTPEQYAAVFALGMAFVCVAMLALVAATARRLWGEWLIPSCIFSIAIVVLSPLAITRLDAGVAFCLALSIWAAASRRPLLSWAALGFGAAAKLIPAVATIPLALAGSGRAAARGYLVFCGVVALFFGPALLAGPKGFFDSLMYQAGRGVQLESVAASIFLALDRVERIERGSGAWDVHGPGVELAAGLSFFVIIGLVLLSGLAIRREVRRRGFRPQQLPRHSALVVLAFVLGSKVLSPQYIIWISPMIPLSVSGGQRIGMGGLLLAICWLTSEIAFHYSSLIQGSRPSIELLATRNLLLCTLWAWLMAITLRLSRSARPARRSGPGSRRAAGAAEPTVSGIRADSTSTPARYGAQCSTTRAPG
jgi:hypothetical protein